MMDIHFMIFWVIVIIDPDIKHSTDSESSKYPCHEDALIWLL